MIDDAPSWWGAALRPTVTLVLLLTAATTAGCRSTAAASSAEVNASAAKPGTAAVQSPGAVARARVEHGAVLLDVRTPEEFEPGHIDGAMNIPVAELSARIGELGASERAVVVYCRSGNRSAQATRILQAQGHADVFDLGPMSAW